MEQFFQEIYFSILYEWVKGFQKELLTHTKDEGIYFQKESIQGVIHFWPNYIIEEEVFNKEKEERIFYLHFQINDLHRVQSLIQEFFDFIKTYPTQKRKILLCCSSAITTTYFAHEMNELAIKLNMPYSIDAVGYTNLEKVINDYELVLLAPQISYLDAKIKKQFQNKRIVMMTPKIFATNHYLDALKQVDEEVKRNGKNFISL